MVFRKKSIKKDNGFILVITDHGLSVRAIVKSDAGEIEDSEGVKYTRSMLQMARFPNGFQCVVAPLEVKAFQTLEQLSSELSNIIFHEAMKVETGAHRIVQWVVAGAQIVIGIMIIAQLGGLQSSIVQELADVDARLAQLLTLVTGPVRIDVP